MTRKPTSTAEYLAALDDLQRATLARLDQAIREAAPGAKESFSYGIPAYSLDGRPLIWYAAWKRHYSLYPIGPAILASLASDVEGYETSKGTIRFPASKELPWDLVRKLAAARVAELRERGR